MAALDLNRLEAVKGASSLLLDASFHVKRCDDTLGVVNATVLLASFHSTILNLDLILCRRDFDLDGFEAIKCAGGLLLNAFSKVESGDHAFCIVDTAVLLASAHI
jgi:hypothetical protein